MTTGPFDDVPPTAAGHFQLNVYAAVYWLVDHLRRMGRAAAPGLDAAIERYPFLAGYGAEIRRRLPEGLTWPDAKAWWRSEIARWERATEAHLPLRALTDEGLLDFPGRLALMLIGLVEEDSRFGSLFAWLQEPLAHRRPGLELVGQVIAGAGSGDDGARVCRALAASGLLEIVNEDQPRSEWVPRMPAVLWDAARGGEATAPPGCRRHRRAELARVEDLVLPANFLAQLGHAAPLLGAGQAAAIVLRGTPGSERLRAMGALARTLGRDVIEVVDLEAGALRALGPLCVMTGALPVLTYDLAPGQTADPRPLVAYRGPVGILLGLEGGLGGEGAERAITLTLPPTRAAERLRCWQDALAGRAVEGLAEIGERFHLPGGYIRQVAQLAVAGAALAGRETVMIGDVRGAGRALNHQLLDTLATRLEVDGDWELLVVGAATAAKVHELERRCRHREALLDHLGLGFGASTNPGVRALFTGASGTGKTLAAKILAGRLGMDLYRVDLAAIVNKYIGETEKNLHRVLSRAEELDVLLLLDEGDSLLGARTQVRSANDRYANLETNYLLQRLESYRGIVLVTTNASEHIDAAFQRRMDVVVNFLPPEASERWRIWGLHLPARHGLEAAWLEHVAVRCALTGAQIRGAALHATLLALDEDGLVRRRHVEEAIQSEYRKAGATCPLTEPGGLDGRASSAQAFVTALGTWGDDTDG
jgi:ATPase family protein associated with various cellular activities (AAA)